MDDLRDAALDINLWPELQAKIEALLGASGSMRAIVDDNGNPLFSETRDLPELDSILPEIARIGEPFQFTANNPNWRRFVDQDFIDERGMERSEFYIECERFDIRYRLGLRLMDEAKLSAGIVWFWPRSAGPVDEHRLNQLAPLEAPLRLSAAIANRLGDNLGFDRDFLDALHAAKTAAMVIDGDGFVLQANASMQAVFEKRDGLDSRLGGKIFAHHRPSADNFVRLLRKASAAIREGQTTGGVAVVQRLSGLPPFFITVAPLSLRRQFFGRSRSLLLALVSDPAASPRSPASALREAFNLTRVEADVAMRLVQGSTTSEIAEARGVSSETVKTQVKALLAKTETSRQSELVGLLSRTG